MALKPMEPEHLRRVAEEREALADLLSFAGAAPGLASELQVALERQGRLLRQELRKR